MPCMRFSLNCYHDGLLPRCCWATRQPKLAAYLGPFKSALATVACVWLPIPDCIPCTPLSTHVIPGLKTYSGTGHVTDRGTEAPMACEVDEVSLAVPAGSSKLLSHLLGHTRFCSQPASVNKMLTAAPQRQGTHHLVPM